MTLVYVFGSGECDQLGKFRTPKWSQKKSEPIDFHVSAWKLIRY